MCNLTVQDLEHLDDLYHRAVDAICDHRDTHYLVAAKQRTVDDLAAARDQARAATSAANRYLWELARRLPASPQPAESP